MPSNNGKAPKLWRHFPVPYRQRIDTKDPDPYDKGYQRLGMSDVSMFPQERCESLGQGSKSVTGRSTEQRA